MGPEDNRKAFNELGLLEKFNYLLHNITIEPVIALYIVLSNAIQIVSTTFKLEKSCVVNNDYPEAICEDILAGINTNATLVNNIQKTVSQMSSWVDPIQSILMFILLLFIGSWSDRSRRRKPCLLLPLTGEVASMIGLILCTFFFTSLPVEVNGLVQAILPSITGGLMCIQIAIFSYISDITREDERTFRISLAATLINIVQPFGAYLSSVVYKHGKYYGTFGICGCLYFMNFLYGLFVLREPSQPKTLSGSFCKDFFDYTHITDTVNTVLKKREGNTRLKIILVMVLSVLLTAPIFGEGKIGQLFLMKQLGWDLHKVAHYVTFYNTVSIIGSFIVLGVLGSNLKINDCVVGIVGCAMKIFVNILYSISKEDQTFYMVSILESLSGVSVMITKSITTKLVPAEELGKLYAFCGIAVAASSIVVPSVYDLVYLFTIDILPGAFFLIGVLIYSLAILIFLWLYVLQNREVITEMDPTACAMDNKGFEDIDLSNEINTKL